MTFQILFERLDGNIFQKIASKHFDEIRPYIQFENLEFQEKLFQVFL